jgi:hypothetical protein
MSSPQVWIIAQIIFDTLGPMVSQCVVNQTQSYWLLFNAFTIANFFNHQNVNTMFGT